MNLRIRSRRLDLHEITNNDHQYSYVVQVFNESNTVIDARVAYGIVHRTAVTRELIVKHGSQYIVKIEHEE